MKKRYLVAILVVIAACITTFNYTLNIPSPLPTGKLIPRPSNYYKWSLTGASFITTPVQIGSPVVGAQTKHTCLSGNDESCFLITVWS